MPGMGSVFLLLASETQRCPRRCTKTFGANLFLAIEATTEAPFFNAGERGPNFPQYVRSTLRIATCQFAFSGDMHVVQRVRSLLDRDAVAFRDLRAQVVRWPLCAIQVGIT